MFYYNKTRGSFHGSELEPRKEFTFSPPPAQLLGGSIGKSKKVLSNIPPPFAALPTRRKRKVGARVKSSISSFQVIFYSFDVRKPPPQKKKENYNNHLKCFLFLEKKKIIKIKDLIWKKKKFIFPGFDVV